LRTEPDDRAPTRIGIVGLGHAGSIHLDAVREIRTARVVAVCDASPDARQRADALRIRAYASLDAMLDSAMLDGVVVCTPPADHAVISRRCLAHGLHVLCEKPLAPTTGDVLTMLQASTRAQRRLLVASKFRHVPEVLRARTLLRSGEIGDPVSFEICFCSPVDMRARWNSQHPLSGGGVIIDNGCHAFDIVAYLFGSIRRVLATRSKARHGIAVEDSATLQVWAGEGIVGRVDLSWSLALPRDSYLVVQGTCGSIEIGWHGARWQRAGGEWHAFGGAYDKLAAHRAMHERFAAAIAGVGEPWISAAECLQTVAAVDAAYRSLASGTGEPLTQSAHDLEPVSLPEPAADDAPLAVASH
jgi:predicted dehydrogenase